jgi:hypothetical protein
VTELNWQQMATGVGDFLAVGMLVVVFKAVFGGLWTDTINRIATLVLATAIPPLAIYAMGGATWQMIVLAAFNGIIVAGSLLGVNEVYRGKIARDQGLTLPPRKYY